MSVTSYPGLPSQSLQQGKIWDVKIGYEANELFTCFAIHVAFSSDKPTNKTRYKLLEFWNLLERKHQYEFQECAAVRWQLYSVLQQ